MGDVVLALVLLTLGFVPLVAKLFLRARMALFFGMVWLIVWGVFLLRPSANNPHPFGIFVFLIIFIEWLAAMLILWINRDHISKEVAK